MIGDSADGLHILTCRNRVPKKPACEQLLRNFIEFRQGSKREMVDFRWVAYSCQNRFVTPTGLVVEKIKSIP